MNTGGKRASAGLRRRAASNAVGKADRDAALKTTTVEFVAKEADEQVVTGVVMVPHSVDRQGDYETPDTIESFADQFASLYENGDADGGVMHAAWPSEWMDLEHNGVVGRDAPPESVADAVDDGDWVQSWRVNDDGLWGLIQDDIISGFSIGARDVSWRGPIEQADLPAEVDVPDEYPDDAPVYELEDGIIREVSAVDTPAVPDALILAKDMDADAAKALRDHLGDRDGFVAEAQQRGHTEGEAERLWDTLSRATDVEGSDSPGKESLYERVGKAAAKAIPGLPTPGDADGYDDASAAETQTRADTTAKEGRTLSAQNRDSLFATIDASLDILHDAGVDHGMTRFTDREDTAFDLSEHTARTWPKPDTETDSEAADATEQGAPTDDTTDDTDTNTTDDTTMSDDNTDDTDKADDPFEDAPAWAASLKDSVEENSAEIAELADKADDDDDDEDDEDDDKDASADALDDAPEWAKALAENVSANAEAIESIGKQSGYSTQVSGGETSEDKSEQGGMDEVKALLS